MENTWSGATKGMRSNPGSVCYYLYHLWRWTWSPVVSLLIWKTKLSCYFPCCFLAMVIKSVTLYTLAVPDILDVIKNICHSALILRRGYLLCPRPLPSAHIEILFLTKTMVLFSFFNLHTQCRSLPRLMSLVFHLLITRAFRFLTRFQERYKYSQTFTVTMHHMSHCS